MSNDVQSHEEVAERVAGEERRASSRHAARSLGSVTARIIGGSQVDLVNFSNRGVLFECDSRLLIGARASVRITTTDANLIVTGRVVRSRVKGLVNGALRYDAALVLDAELGLVPKFVDAPVATERLRRRRAPRSSPSSTPPSIRRRSRPTWPNPRPRCSKWRTGPISRSTRRTTPSRSSSADLDVAPEPPPIPELASPAIEAAGLEASAEPDRAEPLAFEADAEIAFEPAVEFAFDEAGEPSFDDAALDSVDGGAVAGRDRGDRAGRPRGARPARRCSTRPTCRRPPTTWWSPSRSST